MRGTGTTTQQLKSAPHEALFIYYRDDLSYPKSLCKKLNRTDIIVRGPRDLTNWEGLIGLQYPAVIVDHATEGTSERHFGFSKLLLWIRGDNKALVAIAESIYKHHERNPGHP